MEQVLCHTSFLKVFLPSCLFACLPSTETLHRIFILNNVQNYIWGTSFTFTTIASKAGVAQPVPVMWHWEVGLLSAIGGVFTACMDNSVNNSVGLYCSVQIWRASHMHSTYSTRVKSNSRLRKMFKFQAGTSRIRTWLPSDSWEGLKLMIKIMSIAGMRGHQVARWSQTLTCDQKDVLWSLGGDPAV